MTGKDEFPSPARQLARALFRRTFLLGLLLALLMILGGGYLIMPREYTVGSLELRFTAETPSEMKTAGNVNVVVNPGIADRGEKRIEVFSERHFESLDRGAYWTRHTTTVHMRVPGQPGDENLLAVLTTGSSRRGGDFLDRSGDLEIPQTVYLVNAGQNVSSAELKGPWNEQGNWQLEAVRSMVEDMLWALPRHEIHVGDTWSRQFEGSLKNAPNVRFMYSAEYVFERFTRWNGIEMIEISMHASGWADGLVIFADPDEGRPYDFERTEIRDACRGMLYYHARTLEPQGAVFVDNLRRVTHVLDGERVGEDSFSEDYVIRSVMTVIR